MKSLIIAVPVWSETTPRPPPFTPLQELMEKPFGPYYPPIETEPDHNPVLQQFLTVRPPSREDEIAEVVIPLAKPLDLGFFVVNPLIPETDAYIQYSGSLTTPPCSDSTTWFVRRRPMLASNSQTKAFADSIMRLTNMHGNFRAVMPVNQRPLGVYRAKWVLKLSVGTIRLPLGPNARTDREFQAEKMAQDAGSLATDSLDYMHDVGHRLRRSAWKLQKELGKPFPMAPANGTTEEEAWQKAVLAVRAGMRGVLRGVEGAVDQNMREGTLKTHRRAAAEGMKANRMTMAWARDNQIGFR